MGDFIVVFGTVGALYALLALVWFVWSRFGGGGHG